MSTEITTGIPADDDGHARRSGVRLSRIRGGGRTWQLWLLAGDDPSSLRATIAALVELDAELEHAYGKADEAER